MTSSRALVMSKKLSFKRQRLLNFYSFVSKISARNSHVSDIKEKFRHSFSFLHALAHTYSSFQIGNLLRCNEKVDYWIFLFLKEDVSKTKVTSMSGPPPVTRCCIVTSTIKCFIQMPHPCCGICLYDFRSWEKWFSITAVSIFRCHFFEANNVVNLYTILTMKHTIETYHGQCVKAPSGIRNKH